MFQSNTPDTRYRNSADDDLEGVSRTTNLDLQYRMFHLFFFLYPEGIYATGTLLG